ncbi:NAD-dependent succinate-semialdehyde dehydrogenase [Nocardioides daeguensis]|uniref:NAD-dependent succinate-semialdehyde dehydrogenase n=1 Tax=Nocardioides daeguensis TaxID=908359 RepID=A0ABP6UWC3_9ACTN|nr:NAD-dependent succinate-semialdehyde dehydrogenase [Nocardioides daeguensis]MBV6725611.1 NAD-dependent succinate-semialdehyde dehydrogenase [Nocardioides daeguensis]MCR1772874.1 NAD-dependent succinate-semialdehyde dehydrogenase [Nocardioides daeguensis]
MSETTFEVHDPATGAVIDTVANGTVADATAAVDAASAAFPAWAATPARARAEILRRCYDLMIRDADLLTGLIASENGKSVADARAEVNYAAEFFRWFSEEAVRGEGTYGDAPAGNAKTLVTYAPVGVAALVTPWNFPAAMATRKIAPALAAGCTVVLKPAAETPLTALAVAKILLEAGVPEGVVNVVPTTEAAAVVTTWLEDPRVRKVSFTGSTGVGRTLLRQAADRVLNSSMELGGNAPFVITADADIDAAVAGAMIAKFRGGGQACTAANRFYVHADVAAEFVEKFGAAVAALKVGPSADATNQIGPVISEKALTGIAKLVDAAVADGAKVAVQGDVPAEGWFFPPTILVDVPADAPILSEEIFGPVAPVVTWTDEAQMLASVNDTEFGLAAYVYAGRLQDALRLAERIDAGMVGINRGIVSDPSAPFGGVKQSGIGREGAHEGIREYQETRYYSVDWS